jgi:hypothetical protein
MAGWRCGIGCVTRHTKVLRAHQELYMWIKIMKPLNFETDHFKIYEVMQQEARANLFLKGQFDLRRQAMRLTSLEYFANPVLKDVGTIRNNDTHLAWYRGIGSTDRTRYHVILTNQFGSVEAYATAPVGLLVPTKKFERKIEADNQHSIEVLDKLDHFKVYPLQPIDPSKVPGHDHRLQLRDQFDKEPETVRLLLPVFLAVPVDKYHGESHDRIHRPKEHLLIYQITPQDFQKKVWITNQLGTRVVVTVVRSSMLAVPSLKEVIRT